MINRNSPKRKTFSTLFGSEKKPKQMSFAAFRREKHVQCREKRREKVKQKFDFQVVLFVNAQNNTQQ